MGWAWKCCGNCHLSDKCELKEELVDKGEFCEKYLQKPINEELDFVQEHKKIPVNLQIIKQEPKIVIYSGDGYADEYMVYDTAECPNCGYEYEEGDKDWKEPFCPHCGQALKWESEG